MRIHYIQHIHFETPANIFNWVKEKNHQISGTKLFLKEELPSLEQFDFLIVMGGPMGVYDEDKYPWLVKEKKFIEQSIKADKKVLGICLGAQLIADVLGAKVYKNSYKEIGWFPVHLTKEGRECISFRDFPKQFIPFHWHGDTFEIPTGAVHTSFSEGCKNQSFEYNKGKVVGLQFHLETNEESAKALIENSVTELMEKGKYIQNPEKMLSNKERFLQIEKLLFYLLDNMVKR